jgi:predicted metal-dependent hydrolase
MENVWIEQGRQRGDLWQGLTQLAVALAHVARGNRAGARRVYRKALSKLPDDVRQTDPRIDALLKFARRRLGPGPESDHQASAGRTDASQ